MGYKNNAGAPAKDYIRRLSGNEEDKTEQNN